MIPLSREVCKWRAIGADERYVGGKVFFRLKIKNERELRSGRKNLVKKLRLESLCIVSQLLSFCMLGFLH